SRRKRKRALLRIRLQPRDPPHDTVTAISRENSTVSRTRAQTPRNFYPTCPYHRLNLVGVAMSTTGQNLLKGILAVLFAFALLVTVTVLGTFWAVRHYARIEVHTPLGDLEVEKPEEVARKLDLTMYLGASCREQGVSRVLLT